LSAHVHNMLDGDGRRYSATLAMTARECIKFCDYLFVPMGKGFWLKLKGRVY